MFHRVWVPATLSLLLVAAVASAGTNAMISVGAGGEAADDQCFDPRLNADGRYVVFESQATNLVAGDTNGVADVFLRDRVTRHNSRLSVASGGAQANGRCYGQQISADGRYVAFLSRASNLVPGDTGGYADVFIHDRVTARTTRVSVATSGSPARGASYACAISADGRYVVFSSDAHNLAPGGTHGGSDIFLRDCVTSRTTLISAGTGVARANDWSGEPSVSGDGRYVAFRSLAADLVPGDTNGRADIFVRDCLTGRTTRVSLAPDGGQANGDCWTPLISADGRYVAFSSAASNLVPGDANEACDVFVCDVLRGATTRQSVASGGGEADGDCQLRGMSANGRCLVMVSSASNLAGSPAGTVAVCYLRDCAAGTTTPIPCPKGCALYNSRAAAISADARYLAFHVRAAYLVHQCFVHDRGTNQPPLPPPVDDPLPPATDYLPGPLLRTNLHSHTSASTEGLDHVGAPLARALLERAVLLGLDALGLSDHAEAVNANEWQGLESVTAAPPSGSLALRGFEWTLSSGLADSNHLNVFGSRGTAVARAGGSGDALGDLRDTVPALYTWLADAPSIYGTPVVAQFNHISIDGSHFDAWSLPTNVRIRRLVVARLALAELAIGSHERSGQSKETIPNDPLEGEVQWQAALRQGWRLAPSFGADNYASLGSDARRYHTGVYLHRGARPSQWALMQALLGRRTFASQDHNAEAQLSLGGYFMGCQGVQATSPVTVQVRYRPRSNPAQLDGPQATCELIGSNARRVLPATVGWDGEFFIWRATLNLKGSDQWMYAKITQDDGDLVYTAPVWYNVAAAAATPVLAISAASAAPTDCGTQIRYVLSAPATVTLTIANIAGRRVRELSAVAGRPGLNTVLWDGRGPGGAKVPSGRYLLRLVARGQNGEQCQALVSCGVSR